MKIFFQFSKYTTAALASTVSDWLVFTLLIFTHTYFLYAQAIARIIGGITSFILNRYWAFPGNKNRKIHIEARRFLLLYAASFLLSIGLLYVLGEVVNIPVFLAKALADGSCFLFNFAVMKLYVFDERAGFTALFKKLFQAN